MSIFKKISRSGKDFHSDKLNIVNFNDKKYTSNRYKISVLISNAVAPCFIVYANNGAEAINELDNYCQVNGLSVFENTVEEDELENYYETDNGNYINLSYVSIVEI